MMLDDTDLQNLINLLMGVSDRLAAAQRYTDAALVAGGVQAIRALRTRLDPPEEAKPGLAVVPAEAG